MGSLASKIPYFSNLDLECRVREFVNLDGSWNLDMFRFWLPEDVICRIINIPPPHPDSGLDRVVWARSTSGVFSVRSAYGALKESTWKPPDNQLEHIWKYPGPQRVRIFL